MAPHVVIGREVYRLIEAAEPGVADPGAEDPKTDPAPAKEDEEKATAKDLIGSVDALARRVIDDLDAAKVAASAPLISGTKEGLRYIVEVEPIGALEQSESTLTFDFGTSLLDEMAAGNWKAVFSLTGLNDLGVSQVVWNYEGAQLVGANPQLVEALLKSVAILQNSDARPKTDIFGGIEPEEKNEEKLRDWILNVAEQMAAHGVGAQGYSSLQDVEDAFKRIQTTLDPAVAGPYSIEYIRKSIKGSKPGGGGSDSEFIDMGRLLELIEIGVEEKVLTKQLARSVVNTFEKVESEPINYFQIKPFLKMIERGEIEGAFTKEEVDNAKKAMDTFDDDADWQKALKAKIDKQAPLTVDKDFIISAVDTYSSQAGYNIEAGVKIIPTEENTIQAAIAAPFPFFYTFDTERVGELSLLEAAMVFFDREIFVTIDRGEDAITELLKADVSLARALEQSIAIEMSNGTKPRDADVFANQLSRALQGKEPEGAAQPEAFSSPPEPAPAK